MKCPKCGSSSITVSTIYPKDAHPRRVDILSCVTCGNILGEEVQKLETTVSFGHTVLEILTPQGKIRNRKELDDDQRRIDDIIGRFSGRYGDSSDF